MTEKFKIHIRLPGGRYLTWNLSNYCFGRVCLLVFVITAIVLSFAYFNDYLSNNTKDLFLLLSSAVLITFFYIVSKKSAKKNAEQKRIKKELNDICSQICSILHEIEEQKNFLEQIRLCDELLPVIKEAKEHPLASTIMQDLKEAEKKAVAIKRSRPVQHLFEQADREKFKGHTEKEIELLLDALYEAKKLGTADDDFAILGIMLERAGKPLTLADIEKRAKELGWKGVS